jgi:fatty-acyl-CoA synthase
MNTDDLMKDLAGSRTFTERLDRVEALFADAIALQFIASGTLEEHPCVMRRREFVALSRRRANALARLAGGQVIAGLLPISPTSYPAQVAAMAAGTLATINYFLEAEALVSLVKASAAKLLLTAGHYDDDPNCLEKIAKLRAAVPSLVHVVFDADGALPEGSLDVAVLEAAESSTCWPEFRGSADPARVLGLFHTGGTTGLPKLVPLTQSMILAMADSCACAQGTVYGETVLAPLPQFHTSGALQVGLAPILSGAEIVIPCSRGFRAPELFKTFWRFVARHKATLIGGVPTILSALAASQPDADTRSVKTIISGGAPLSIHVIEALRKFLPEADFLEGWGMTETCGFSVMNPRGRMKVGAVGLPFPGVQVEVRRTDAATHCAVDEIGEVVVRGNIVIRRYHDERPDSFTQDGWLRTGDRGRLDADGYLWITGRVKDLIIRGGHNLEPALIEEPAYQHPAVQLAAAVGRPCRYAGELPVLYVQLKAGAQATERDIADFIAPRIQERAAIPKSVHILPALPLSGPGKISKLNLRREAARSQFQAEVDAITGAKVMVRIDDDKRFEHVAVLSGTANANQRAVIERALEGYTLRHRWE